MRIIFRNSHRGLRAPHFIPALEAVELPAFATGGAAGSKPVEEHEAGVGGEVEFLPLRANGTSEGLDRIGRKDEQGTGLERGAGLMSAGERGGVAINLGRGLRAQKATRVGTDAKVELGLISGHESAAEAAGVSPHALAARTRRQELERTGGVAGGDGAFAGDDLNFERCAPGAKVSFFGGRDHGFRCERPR